MRIKLRIYTPYGMDGTSGREGDKPETRSSETRRPTDIWVRCIKLLCWPGMVAFMIRMSRGGTVSVVNGGDGGVLKKLLGRYVNHPQTLKENDEYSTWWKENFETWMVIGGKQAWCTTRASRLVAFENIYDYGPSEIIVVIDDGYVHTSHQAGTIEVR